MAPRTVLFLHSSAGRYGADRQLLALAAGLDPARYRAVAMLALDGPLAGDLRAAGVPVIVRPLAVLRRELLSPGGLVGLTRALGRDARALPRLAASHDAALVHANTSVIVGARGARLPTVVHVREIYAGWGPLWPLYRQALRRADALIAVSEATRAPLGAGQVIHDGVAATPARMDRSAARTMLGLPQDGFIVTVLGRISAWKGQELLARALAALPADTIGMVAGDTWPGQERYERALREEAAALGVADKLRIAGFIDEVGAVYGAADVVVVPSTRPDPFPNAALEAAAAGCCVVAAAHGGLPELIRDGVTGRLFPPGAHSALASILAELRARPGERERLGAAAAADVSARFGADRMVAAVQDVYDGVLGAARRL